MTKPIVFSYTDYEHLQAECERQREEIKRLREENANLQMRCSITEAYYKVKERCMDGKTTKGNRPKTI